MESTPGVNLGNRNEPAGASALLDLLARPAWQREAACRNSEASFFPERGETTDHARTLCDGCPVRDECLEFALANGEKFGVWGGTSERGRRVIRRERRAA